MKEYPISEESIEHLGHTISLKWYQDLDCAPPWEDEDGHGPVSEWTSRDKRPGERVLHSDRHSKRYYDFAEAVRIAKRDGWDAPPYKTGTKGQQAVRAAEADYEFLRRWCNDDWCWVGYVITIEDLGYEDSCWGFCSDDIKANSVDIINTAKHWLESELSESANAAARDIVTV